MVSRAFMPSTSNWRQVSPTLSPSCFASCLSKRRSFGVTNTTKRFVSMAYGMAWSCTCQGSSLGGRLGRCSGGVGIALVGGHLSGLRTGLQGVHGIAELVQHRGHVLPFAPIPCPRNLLRGVWGGKRVAAFGVLASVGNGEAIIGHHDHALRVCFPLGGGDLLLHQTGDHLPSVLGGACANGEGVTEFFS